MKLTRVIALILAAAILSIGLVTTSVAEGSYYEEQMKKYNAMKNKNVTVWIEKNNAYARNTQKFWFRKVTGLSYDGAFIVGPWECISDCSDNFILPGTSVMFGYSVDIMWGTDWPYSGCFWGYDKVGGDLVDVIQIGLYGGCRTVYIDIAVNGKTVFVDPNCDSHSEWVPR